MRILLFYAIVFLIGSAARGQVDVEEYNSGYYVDNAGGKIAGLIRYVKGNGARIDYKADKDAKREKIFPDKCREFVINDSIRFIRVEGSFTVKVGVWNIDIMNDFIQVLETGTVNLYLHRSLSGDGNMRNPGSLDWQNYVVRKNSSSVYIGLHPNAKKRKKKLELDLPDDPELVGILSRKNFRDIRSGVREYNEKHRQATGSR